MKRMEFSYSIPKVFEAIEKLKHENDGLIFTPINQPYTPGTCAKMYAYFVVAENIDFNTSLG
jgi:mRNA guanylyltransferase